MMIASSIGRRDDTFILAAAMQDDIIIDDASKGRRLFLTPIYISIGFFTFSSAYFSSAADAYRSMLRGSRRRSIAADMQLYTIFLGRQKCFSPRPRYHSALEAGQRGTARYDHRSLTVSPRAQMLF